MAIVENTEKSLKLADDISIEVMQIVKKHIDSLGNHDDPGEYVYLLVNVSAFTACRMILALHGYGQIYNIQSFDCDEIMKLHTAITLGLLKAHELSNLKEPTH